MTLNHSSNTCSAEDTGLSRAVDCHPSTTTSDLNGIAIDRLLSQPVTSTALPMDASSMHPMNSPFHFPMATGGMDAGKTKPIACSSSNISLPQMSNDGTTTTAPTALSWNTNGTALPLKKYIMYLEPGKETALYQSIMEFFRQSEKDVGPNEAHMYHPHTSMTGFFDMLDSDDLLQETLQYLDQTVHRHFGPDMSTPPRTSTPLSSLPFQCRPSHYHRPHVESIRRRSRQIAIGIQVPPHFHQFTQSLKKYMDDRLNKLGEQRTDLRHVLMCSSMRLRCKEIDHISLAYKRIQEGANEAQSVASSVAGSLDMLVQSMPKGGIGSERAESTSMSALSGMTQPSGVFVASSLKHQQHQQNGSRSLLTMAVRHAARMDRQLDGELDEETLDQLEEMAKETVDMAEQPEAWYIVFYEVEYKSTRIGVPHRFRALRSYRIV